MRELQVLRPVDAEFPVTADFMQINPKLWKEGHKGVDFGAERDSRGKIIRPIAGAPVFFVLNGVVTICGEDPEGYLGKRIWVESETHIGKVRHGYCHLKEIAKGIKVGRKVLGLELAGLVGNSGLSREGTPHPFHLHLQLEMAGTRELVRPVFL